jgi:DnaK suppressor protein
MALTPQQVTQLKEVLEGERRRLLRNAQDGLAFSMNRERNIGRDSIDESMEEELFSTELRLRDREKFLLGKIAGALTRLNEGSINECESCAEPIGFKRLLARPVTTLCIDCKEEAEKEEQVNAQQRGGSRSDDLAGGDEVATTEE